LAGPSDCSCQAGELLLSGGTSTGDSSTGDVDDLIISESRPISTTTWRVSCKALFGEDDNPFFTDCPNPTTILCAN
jgi:hypothetical protein